MTVKSWLYVLLLVLFVILSYSNSIYSPFVLDDFHSFIDNKAVYVKDISFDSLNQISSSKFGKSRIIPLISFAIDHHLGSGSIVQYHLTNIVIHLLCLLAVYMLIRGLLLTKVCKNSIIFFSASSFSLLVTALWALSPVQTNGVTYLVQRMASLVTLFYVSSVAFYLYARLAGTIGAKTVLLLGSFFFGLLSFFTKENSATLPFAVLMVEFLFLSPGKLKSLILSVKKQYWLLIILVIILLLPLAEKLLMSHVLGGYQVRFFSLDERLYTQLRVIVFYISLLLLPLPSRLNLEHDFAISESLFAPPATFLSLFLLMFLIVYAVQARKNKPLISFGILWFFLNLVIESSVIPLEIVFEHRLYLSSIGFFIAVVTFADKFAAAGVQFSPVKDSRKIFLCFAVLLVAVSSILTTLRNNDWRDAIAIQEDIVKKSPRLARPYNALGLNLSMAKRYDEALAALEKGYELDRPYGIESLQIVNNIMLAMTETGRIDEAISRGEQFIRESPSIMDITFMGQFLYNLGVLYLRQNQNKYALEAFKNSLRVNPDLDYVMAAMLQLLRKVYGDPETRTEFGLDEEGKSEDLAIRLKLAEIMFDLRQYDTAENFLVINGRKVEESPYLHEMLDKINAARAMNSLRQQESSIANHLPYRNNSKYRLYLNITDFITKYYHPFRFSVKWFIYEAYELEPADPFVTLRLCQQLLGKGEINAALNSLSAGVERFPNFVPLLDLYVQALNKSGKKGEMTKVLKHILEIYHGHPRWEYYESLIVSDKLSRKN